MQFSSLKYALALLLTGSAVAGEVIVVPSVFEDFAGTTSVRLNSAKPSHRRSGSQWRLDVLVLADELGPGPMTFREIGLRLKTRSGEPPVLSGSVALSTIEVASLNVRFELNAGPAPVVFFTTSRYVPEAPGETGGGHVVFDLPGGFRYYPAVEGNLHISFEVECGGDIVFDGAPTVDASLLVAEGFSARQGTLDWKLPIMRFVAMRERSVKSGLVVHFRAPHRLSTPTRAGTPRRPEHPIVTQVHAVQSHVETLEGRVEQLVEENLRLQSLIESRSDRLVRMFMQDRVEAALASGRPGLALLRAQPEGDQLAVARATLRELLRASPTSPQAHLAAELAVEGDAYLERQQTPLALASYSRAYRALLPESAATNPIVATRAGLGRRYPLLSYGPYDVLEHDAVFPGVVGVVAEGAPALRDAMTFGAAATDSSDRGTLLIGP